MLVFTEAFYFRKALPVSNGMETKQKKEKYNIIWDIVLSAEELSPYKDEALKSLAQELELPGFRAGKVPPEKAREFIQEEKILAEVAFIATRKISAGILNEEKQEWLGQPEIKVTQLDPEKGLSFTLVCVSVPEVNLEGWKKKIKIKRITPEVKPEEIDRALGQVQKSRAIFKAVNRTAQNGDFVEISFSGRSGGVQVEGLNSSKHPFILGEGRFVEGFEDNVRGMSVGEDKSFTLKVASDWMHKAIAGKEIEFTVKLETLQERILPELTDDFAKSLGNFNDLGELKASVGEGLLAEKEDTEKKSMRVRALEQVMDGVSVDIPDILRNQEATRLMDELRLSVESGGLAFEEYLAQIGKKKEELEKDFAKGAEKRVKAALVLRGLAKELQIEPSDEEITKCTDELLAKEDSLEDAQKIDPEERRAYCKSVLRNEKVFEALEQIVLENNV